MGTPSSLPEPLVVEYAFPLPLPFPALLLGQLTHFAKPRNCLQAAHQSDAQQARLSLILHIRRTRSDEGPDAAKDVNGWKDVDAAFLL